MAAETLDDHFHMYMHQHLPERERYRAAFALGVAVKFLRTAIERGDDATFAIRIESGRIHMVTAATDGDDPTLFLTGEEDEQDPEEPVEV